MKMLMYHEVIGARVSADRYIAVKDVHRVDVCEDDVPAYKEGVRAFIRGTNGKDEFCYRVSESAEALVAIIEADER